MLLLQLIACTRNLPDTPTPPACTAETWYADSDGDGFGSETTASACEAPDGYIPTTGDCDDADPTINPGALEACNGYDDNCNGLVDDEESSVTGQSAWVEDGDGDGYGTAGAAVTACAAPPGYVADTTDCDDSEATVHPGSAEVCLDRIDQDCDGLTDDYSGACAPLFQTDPGSGMPGPCDPAVPVDVGLCKDGVAAVLPSGATFAKVQDALDAASAGDVVSLCPGTWPGPLAQHISPLRIAGYGAGVSVLSGAGAQVLDMGTRNELTLVDLSVEGGVATEGAGLRGTQNTLCIARCTFGDNAASDDGGAFDLEGDEASLTLDRVLFVGNYAGYAGGAVVVGGGSATVTDSRFGANASGGDAGAMDIDSRASVTLSNTEFNANTATHYAGALLYGGRGPAETLTLDSVSFVDNFAGTGGGAMTLGDWDFPTVLAQACLFEGNESPGLGGAVLLLSWGGGTLHAVSTEFHGNRAANGGAVAIEGFGTPSVDLEGCTLDGNMATEAGAAVLLLPMGEDATATALVTESTLTSNVAGGASCGAASLSSTGGAVLTSVDSDWGAGTTDNGPDDVCGYTFGAAASFRCTSGTCR